jgi:hypothetical protein
MEANNFLSKLEARKTQLLKTKAMRETAISNASTIQKDEWSRDIEKINARILENQWCINKFKNK